MPCRETILDYYQPKLSGCSEDFEILGWENVAAQEARFRVLADHVKLHQRTLLDVGCGLGSLYDYLLSRGIQPLYTGVDLLREMVCKAKEKRSDLEIVCGDIFENPMFPSDSFDVVFSSGIFNLNLGNNREFFPRAVSVMHDIARETVVFNLLHVHSPDPDERYFYYHPDEVKEILSRALPASTRIRTVSEYLPNDFTVICEKARS